MVGGELLQFIELFYGYGGNDIIFGMGVPDSLFGGKGDDRLYGGSGNDYVKGDQGNDLIYGTDVVIWHAEGSITLADTRLTAMTEDDFSFI